MTWTRHAMFSAMLLAMISVAAVAQAQQVPSPTSSTEVPGTPPGTIMTKDYVETVVVV